MIEFTSSMTECSCFHPWFCKGAISFFPFKLVSLIAACQFCKLDRCLQLRGEIKGKTGGPQSFGCDRMNPSQRAVLTSVAARAQQEPAACLGMGSPVLAVLTQTGDVMV